MSRAASGGPVGLPIGKIITSVIAVAAPMGAISADWNETHVFNPNWTPHAKFHNAQTITLSVATAALTLWEAWRPGPMDTGRLRTMTSYAALFWVTQIPAPFFPGSAVVDPDNPTQPFTKYGIPINQVTGAVLLLPILAGCRALEARRLRLSPTRRSH